MTNTIGRAKIPASLVNRRAQAEPEDFFAECDRRFEEKIASIVDNIAVDTSRSKLILLSGPSASGKTTSSFKIRQGLEAKGVGALTISMDDFFRSREEAPRMADGSPDLESLDALDLELLQKVLGALITDGRAELPTFNFKEGRRDPDPVPVELRQNSVAIVEGLHALDPRVAEGLSGEHMRRVYVSVSSDFLDDAGKPVLTARDVRLIRRMIRDYHFRGSSPENTLDMWEDVCRGEDLYVRPFKRLADVTVNSVFACEPCLFAQSAEALLNQVSPESPHFQRASGLLSAVSRFERMPLSLIPGSSVLREFIGGSDYFNKSGKIRTVGA